jgi:hypothetical protein
VRSSGRRLPEQRRWKVAAGVGGGARVATGGVAALQGAPSANSRHSSVSKSRFTRQPSVSARASRICVYCVDPVSKIPRGLARHPVRSACCCLLYRRLYLARLGTRTLYAHRRARARRAAAAAARNFGIFGREPQPSNAAAHCRLADRGCRWAARGGVAQGGGATTCRALRPKGTAPTKLPRCVASALLEGSA